MTINNNSTVSYAVYPSYLPVMLKGDGKAFLVWSLFNSYDWARKKGKWTHCPKWIARQLNISLKTVYTKIKLLLSLKLLRREGNAKHGYIYSIPENLLSKNFETSQVKTSQEETSQVKSSQEVFTTHNKYKTLVNIEKKEKNIKESNIEGGVLRTREGNKFSSEDGREDPPPTISFFKNFSFSSTGEVNAKNDSQCKPAIDAISKDAHKDSLKASNFNDPPLSGINRHKEKNDRVVDDSRKGDIVLRKDSESNFEWVREMYVLARPNHWSSDAPYLTRGIVKSLQESLKVLGGDVKKMQEMMLKGYEALGKNQMLRDYDFTWFVSRDRFIELGQEAKNQFCGSVSRRTKQELSWHYEAQERKLIRDRMMSEYREKKKRDRERFAI